MKEKKKPEVTAGAGGGSLFDSAAAPVNQNCSISSGPYAEDLPVAGMTVGGIRQRFSDRFDIDEQAQAILNGKPADEDTVLKPGERLMFIRHAGEKGSSRIIIEDDQASIDDIEGLDCRMNLPDLLQRCSPGISTGPVILPSGIKAVLSQGQITVWIYEQPPVIQKLSWIAADSLVPYGPGTKYRNIRIALPYLIIFAVFQRDNNGMPVLIKTDECFFRNYPMTSLNDELMFPALLNCSKFRNDEGNPLSWICTQHLKGSKDMLHTSDPNLRFRAGFEAVRYCLLETSFNLSSEHHEGNSWFGASKKKIPQVATVERWEEETKKDPLFVLDVPWLPTKHTVQQLADRIFNRCGAGAGAVKTSDDLSRIILNK